MTRTGEGGRPSTVTAAAGLTVLGGALDLALGVLFLVAAPWADSVLGSDVATTADRAALLVVGSVLVAIGVWQVGLGVFLARGSNAARLVLTLVLVARQASGWYLVGETGDRGRQGVLSLVVALLTMVLVWNPKASRFFDRRSERSLSESLPAGAGVAHERPALLDIVTRLALLGATIALIPGRRRTRGPRCSSPWP